MKPRLNFYPHFPEAFNKLGEVEELIKKSSLDKHLVHLIKLRASQMNGCNFCVDLHSKQARKDNEKELRLHHVSTWRESHLFNDKERIALEWTETITALSESHVTDDLYVRTREFFSEKEIVELTVAIATINFWNRFAATFRSVAGSQDKIFGVENIIV